ncbi:xenotropic and polytropic retrovirus receptor 1 homolog [Anneissia japonica]|uniref:xenotropic and polytropic retrovirus receptor 1 homolog n=1 Tax=Anneissia japonica TaxID=1529436 RepID=UPI0014258E9F|nr:xenotropic and polytropic retrovirus receptor 1 homolog [Anneissia japonica]
MKFSEHLQAHLTPEWRKQYIDYENLKEIIYKYCENVPQKEEVGEQAVERYTNKIEEEFFRVSDKELTKVNTFFSEKLNEATRRFASLQDECRQFNNKSNQPAMPPRVRSRKSSIFFLEMKDPTMKALNRTATDLKLAVTEFYLNLILLQNYQNLNFTGFRKILKKHDKMFGTEKGLNFRTKEVERSPFFTSKQIDKLILDTETLYINELEGGNRQKAMNKLRVPPLKAPKMNWSTMRVGFFSGIFLVLCIIIILVAIYLPMEIDVYPALKMYRGVFLIIFIIFLLGLNTYGWRKAGVNHVLIFELDPRSNLTHEQLLEIAMFFAVLWGLSIISFMYCTVTAIPPYVNPLLLVTFLAVFLINPFPILYFKARVWLLRVLLRIILAPFFPVGFADFWLADQLNSLVTVLLDFEFLICFYICEVDWTSGSCSVTCGTYGYGARAVVACLPAWFRFAQCLRRYRDTKLVFPHLVNAGKYSTTFLVVIFSSLYKLNNDSSFYNNPLFYFWVVSAVFSSCYTLSWDIKMDWGLLSLKNKENKLLREEIVYPPKTYYLAMFEDFILRFAWTLTVTMSIKYSMFNPYIDIIITMLAILEVFRRFVWNFYRLENEHLNNCGEFRAVRDISVAPLTEDDFKDLECMMDDEEEVPRYKSKSKENGRVVRWKMDEEEDEDDEDEENVLIESPLNSSYSLTIRNVKP